MSSRGTGADISAQDANDLLHKLITESTKVQAAFAGVIPGLAFSLSGVLKVSPDKGLVWVTAGGLTGHTFPLIRRRLLHASMETSAPSRKHRTLQERLGHRVSLPLSFLSLEIHRNSLCSQSRAD